MESGYESMLSKAHAMALQHLAGLRGMRVTPAAMPAAPSPPDGVGFDAALAEVARSVAPFLSASPGPRYLGLVTGGATPEAVAADWLVSAWDQNVSNAAGSIAADLEARTVQAFAGLFGLGERLQGRFVSGATAANLVCLATAREWAAQRGGAATVFAGAAHSSIVKAMAITGIGRDGLRPVATLEGRTAVDVAALDAALASHAGPAIVVASAGEVNTGDFDDLQAVAEVCERRGAWLHVDGAFGLFAALVPELAPRVAGVERADSVTVDLHKWLNVPYDSALAFTSRPDLQRQVFAASSAYLGEDPDPLHYTPENSRRFRAFPAWMVLATRGRAGIAAWVRANCVHAWKFAEGVRGFGCQVLGGVPLNIVCWVPPGDRDAALQRINASGETYMTPTRVFGRAAIRAAFSNWSTTAEDVDIVLRAVRTAIGGNR